MDISPLSGYLEEIISVPTCLIAKEIIIEIGMLMFVYMALKRTHT